MSKQVSIEAEQEIKQMLLYYQQVVRPTNDSKAARLEAKLAYQLARDEVHDRIAGLEEQAGYVDLLKQHIEELKDQVSELDAELESARNQSLMDF